jgi:hypothetical protein
VLNWADPRFLKLPQIDLKLFGLYKSPSTSEEVKRMLSAATKIQRTWRKTHGMGCLGRELNSYPVFEQMRYDLPADPCVFVGSDLQTGFRGWVFKLLVRFGEARALASDPDLLACWMIVLYRRRFQGVVVHAATVLVTSFLNFLLGEYKGLRGLGAEIKEFLALYAEWRAVRVVPFMDVLRTGLIEKLYTSLRDGSYYDRRVAGFLPSSMVEYPSLHALYCVVGRCDTDFISSNVYKAVLIASKNPCWMPAVSRSRLMHELILDNNLTIPFAQSIPQLNTRHTGVDGRIVDSQRLRDDIMSTMIGFVDEADVLEEIAEAFHNTRGCPTAEFARIIFEVFFEIAVDTPIAQQVQSEWESRSSPLEALVLTIRMVRNLLDNMQVNAARQDMAGHIDPNALTRQTWMTMQISQTQRSSAWINELIRSKCSHPMVAAMAASNPYALIEFLDSSILGLVLDNAPVVDYLSPDRLPEFLVYDQDRLILLRSELSTYSFRPDDFMELVNAGKWMGARPCPPTLLRIAAFLRSMLDLCRFCHGQMINSLVIRTAKAAVIP